jgi:small subunit ribosomal protein S21
MARVLVESGDSLERALRRFKRLCEKEGIRRDIKRSSYYEKPSERRRRAVLKQKRQRLKTERKFGFTRPVKTFEF